MATNRQRQRYKRYRHKYKSFKRQESAVHETPTLAAQVLDDNSYTAAIIENAVFDSLPKNAAGQASEVASKITKQLKSSMSDLDLNQDGAVSDNEYQLGLRDRKETFERQLAAGSLAAAVALLFLVVIAAINMKDATIFEGLSAILIAGISGLLVIPAGYAGIKAFMNGRTDQIAIDNVTAAPTATQQELGLNERGM